MKNLDKLAKYSLYFLLGWYLIAPFIWINDSTLSLDLKISYAAINYLILGMLIRVIKNNFKSPSFMDFIVSFMLIIWFFYSTERDYNDNGYDFLLKMFYVAIDLLSTVFCIDTFVNFLLNSDLLLIGKDRINNISNTLKVSLCIFFLFLYFNIYRNIK